VTPLVAARVCAAVSSNWPIAGLVTEDGSAGMVPRQGSCGVQNVMVISGS
jgi:hypothetical protein